MVISPYKPMDFNKLAKIVDAAEIILLYGLRTVF